VSDGDPPGAQEEPWDSIFVEMAQLVEEPVPFVEGPHPPLVPAVDPVPNPEPIDIFTLALANVLEIVPDVQPDHVTVLVHSYLDGEGGRMAPALLVEQILHQLFEDPDYPKVEKKGKKRKNETVTGEPAATESGRNGGERSKKRIKIDYRVTERNKLPSVAYRNLALVSTSTFCGVNVL
jgi:E3 ubiquitin-protein ligase RNF216